MKSLHTQIISVIIIGILSCHSPIFAQQAITSIVTNNITSSQVTYNNIMGAGLRNPSNALISVWDSTGSSFTINYNAPAAANILQMTQFSTASFSSLISMPAAATVKVRRSANPDVGDARNYYNFWAQYSSIPVNGATTGTFNFTAPEVVNPEDAFLLNNLSSGYDNIFQNTIASPHFGNIERIDFIIPAGLECISDVERLQSGVAVIDRGGGDPFKIAAITAIDGSNNPTAFGSLVSVLAANFGANLLSSSFDYAILINDVKYYSQSRPSTRSNQNLKGVYISLADLGLAINQPFYGYALFGPDVTVANPDWTTYPNNSNAGSQLDPVNVTGFYKSISSVLPLSLRFTAIRANQVAKLDFTLYNELKGDYVVVQQSGDGIHFRDIGKLDVHAAGAYTFTDHAPGAGLNYYRLKLTDKNGATSMSGTRKVKFETGAVISVFPNPVAEVLTVTLPVTFSNETVVAEIFTSSGQLIKRTQWQNPGRSRSIDVHALKPGTYSLRLINKKDNSRYLQNFTVL